VHDSSGNRRYRERGGDVEWSLERGQHVVLVHGTVRDDDGAGSGGDADVGEFG
jgi:hypothetical protein